MPADERCGSNQTNSLDIDVTAYRNLTVGMNGGVEWDTVSLDLVMWEVLTDEVAIDSTKLEGQHHAGRTMP